MCKRCLIFSRFECEFMLQNRSLKFMYNKKFNENLLTCVL